jgi:cyanophycinase
MSLPGPAAPAAATAGALVIVGGGRLTDVIRDRFIELAGGKDARIVVIPTASWNADYPERIKSLPYWKAQHVASVVLLHTRDRKRANDPAFVKPLTRATGVWLTGGNQSKLVAAYGGTAVERELRNLLARGGVIGGTSAGAEVMGSLMIYGGNPVATAGRGLGFVPGVVFDVHFMHRHRLNRLLGVLANHPGTLGLGIDERTSVILTGRTLEVLGSSGVWVCLSAADKQPQELRTKQHADLDALIRAATERMHPSSPDRGKPPATKGGTAPVP